MAAEEHIDRTIAALKIIGMVPRNGKLCVRKGQLAIDDPENSQGLRRWLRGDSRDLTLMHARNVINSAVKISKALVDAYTTVELAAWTLERFVREMEQCEAGLRNDVFWTMRLTHTFDLVGEPEDKKMKLTYSRQDVVRRRTRSRGLKKLDIDRRGG